MQQIIIAMNWLPKKNLIFLLSSFVIFFSTCIYSQVSEEWIHRYTGPESSADTPKDFYTDASGNIFITGSTILSGGFSDIITAKFNSAGVRQWIASYTGAGNNNDDGTSVTVGDGRQYLCLRKYTDCFGSI